ncbi:protein DOG1-like 3 [Rutidosis leptorrhynchoides]|uniref:protein DOG1-like 3 n=1 Tax=Rutidosis leptorrhynchoides TaxID=125765 RepID=UPI003A993152
MIENNNNHRNHNFHRFFDWWLGELNINLQHLISAANHQHNFEDDSVLLPLIDKVVGHYENYYKVKSNGAKRDVISMFAPTWLTSLENSLLWIAGWRPTTAIHLLYSKSGIQLEAKLADLVPVLTDDLSDLSIIQINRIDELHKETIREERIISESLALMQESVADTLMVDLSNSISEKMRNDKDDDGEIRDIDLEVELMFNLKKGELEEVLHKADSLRIETLKAVVAILTPIQVVYFLIAAAELHLRIHDWGQKMDKTT